MSQIPSSRGRRAAEAGVVAWALSKCYRHGVDAPRPGLVLGFAAYTEAEISEAVRTLAGVVGRPRRAFARSRI